jgi:O-antigen/teichoic acid export membrane protein
MAAWASIEYLAYPILMFIATPTLIRHLGIEAFGLWMLVATVVGSWGLANLGGVPMITRYVAIHRDQNDLDSAIQIVRFGLGWSMMGGGIMALSLVLAGPWLSTGWLHPMGDSGDVEHAVILSGLMIFLAQIEFSFKAALKGFELFGLAARVEIACKSLFVIVSLVLASCGMGVFNILLSMLGFSIFNCLVYGWAITFVMGRDVWWPQLRPPDKDVHTFAGWNWLQVFSGILFHQMDRLLIGALLGPVPLAAYSVCLQIAQQIHAFPAALFSFLLPRLSRGVISQGFAIRLSIIGLLVAISLGIPIMFFSNCILERWMGSDFANHYDNLMLCLAGAYMLLSVNIVPHFITLANGNARFISMINLLGGVSSLIICIILVNNVGLIGVAFGKFAFGFVLLSSYLCFAKQKFNVPKI